VLLPDEPFRAFDAIVRKELRRCNVTSGRHAGR